MVSSLIQGRGGGSGGTSSSSFDGGGDAGDEELEGDVSLPLWSVSLSRGSSTLLPCLMAETGSVARSETCSLARCCNTSSSVLVWPAHKHV